MAHPPDLSKQCLGVLTEQRRRSPHGARCLVETPGQPERRDRAQRRMLDLPEHLVLQHLRILEQRLVVVADDRDASALLDHRLEVRGAVLKGVGLEGLDERVSVEGPREGGRPARIHRHLLRHAEPLAEHRPSALVPDEAEVDREIAGARLILGRVRGRGEVPAALERVVALRRVELRLDREQRAEFGDLDLLAAPAARAVDDRGHHALHREDPGGHRRGVRAEAQRRLVEGAEVAPDVAHRLQHDLAAQLVAQRPALAERGDVAVDQLRVGRRQILVAQTQPLRFGRREVGHEHVGARDQAVEGGTAGAVLDIEHDASLVAVEREEDGAFLAPGRAGRSCASSRRPEARP